MRSTSLVNAPKSAIRISELAEEETVERLLESVHVLPVFASDPPNERLLPSQTSNPVGLVMVGCVFFLTVTSMELEHPVDVFSPVNV